MCTYTSVQGDEKGIFHIIKEQMYCFLNDIKRWYLLNIMVSGMHVCVCNMNTFNILYKI